MLSDLTAELATLAEKLQRATVQVYGRGGGGSGVVWQTNGLIVTNAHVAHGPRVAVELSDGRRLRADVVARAKQRDLALLLVDERGLPAAEIGDSDNVRAGELVVATGYPLGFGGALTAGIVHRGGSRSECSGQRWVCADVRLAPGNSGGPLADAQGRVVGINSQIYYGLALAVPSNDVCRFISEAAREGGLSATRVA